MILIPPPHNGKVPSNITMGCLALQRPKHTHSHTQFPLSLVLWDMQLFWLLYSYVLLRPFVIFIGYMVHVHAIKLLIQLFWGDYHQSWPYPVILSLWFIDAQVLKFDNYLNITLGGVPSFSVSAGLRIDFSSSLEFCKDRSFVFL